MDIGGWSLLFVMQFEKYFHENGVSIRLLYCLAHHSSQNFHSGIWLLTLLWICGSTGAYSTILTSKETRLHSLGGVERAFNVARPDKFYLYQWTTFNGSAKLKDLLIQNPYFLK